MHHAGTPDAGVPRMGVRSYTDLDAWRLANELKLGVYALIETDKVRRDEDFYRQIRNAASSAPRNIAEGFGRYQPAEFSQYLRVANGSLLETANHLQDGRGPRLLRCTLGRTAARTGPARIGGHDTPAPVSQNRTPTGSGPRYTA